jgi:SAM-dependent methyltransferase
MGPRTQTVTGDRSGTASAGGGGCAACGAKRLSPHLSLATGAVPEGLIPTTDQFGAAFSDIVQCDACGHMQLARFPPATRLLEGYAEAESTDYLPEEPGQRATARAALEMIERHVARGALLDVGCWVGFLLAEALERGWSATGLEPSKFASAYARDRLGLDVRTADLFTAELAPAAFDAIVLGDVIEHLPDPGAALERIAEVAAPGAVLHLSLPDAGSRVARLLGARWWSVIPTHVQYFTHSSLTTLLSRHRFEVLELTTAPKAFTVRYYLGRIRGYSEPLSEALVRIAEASRIAERIWVPDLRDRMAVLARAPL